MVGTTKAWVAPWSRATLQPRLGGEGGEGQQTAARVDRTQDGGHPGDVEGRGGQHERLVLPGPGELDGVHDVGHQVVVAEQCGLGCPRGAAGEQDDRRTIGLGLVGDRRIGVAAAPQPGQPLGPLGGRRVGQLGDQGGGGHHARVVEPGHLAPQGLGRQPEVEGGVGGAGPGRPEQGGGDGSGTHVGVGQGGGPGGRQPVGGGRRAIERSSS